MKAVEYTDAAFDLMASIEANRADVSCLVEEDCLNMTTLFLMINLPNLKFS